MSRELKKMVFKMSWNKNGKYNFVFNIFEHNENRVHVYRPTFSWNVWIGEEMYHNGGSDHRCEATKLCWTSTN